MRRSELSSRIVETLPLVFGGYVAHALLFYRQNDLKGFEELLRLGREMRLELPGWNPALRASRSQRLAWRGFLKGEDSWGSRRLSMGSIRDFEEALRLDPGNLWARMGLGMALEMRRRYTRARAQFEKAQALAPRWHWPHVFRGVCLWYQAEFEASIAAFERAATLAPKDPLPLLFSARAKADIRDRSLVADLDKALELAPDSGFALSWRGRALFVLKRTPSAIRDLERSIRLLPDYDRGWSWLGVSLIEQGKPRRAIPYLRKARELNPYYPTTLYPLAGALLSVGRWAEAEKVLREAVAVDRSGIWVEHRISMSHPVPAARRSKDDLDRFLAKRPKSAWAWAWRGQTELLLQNYGRALADLTRALELDPADRWARLWRGETLRRLGEWEAALSELGRCRGLSWALAARADCLLALGEPARALAEVERSLKKQDFCGPAHAIRGRALLALGRKGEAALAFERALEHHPRDRWSARLLEQARGRRPAAGARPDAAFAPDRLAEDAESMGLTACARALRRGELARALESCAGDGRRESRLYRLRGWLKLRSGDAAGAAEEASRALDDTLDPGDAAALWLRGQARAALAK